MKNHKRNNKQTIPPIKNGNHIAISIEEKLEIFIGIIQPKPVRRLASGI